VSRELRVTDLDNSLAFYRDVLGFGVRSAEGADVSARIVDVVSGPAHIQLVKDPAFARASEQRAVLFFETSAVVGMRAALTARGGAPSELQNVNWIKMQVFEVRDPDGHTLWFGQSLDAPHPYRPEPMMRTIMPSFPLADVGAGVAYYRDVLGFTVNYAQHDIGVMDRDDVRILLVARTEQYTGIGSCYVYVRDADALHAELRQRGADVQGEPISHTWGLRDFTIGDLEGNEITFGQPFE
jgi:catechol 2,3-dioxygenase-like lactoylglutathione lyase family enzyme